MAQSTHNPLTAAEVADIIERAVRNMRRLPPVFWEQNRAMWPEYIHTAQEVWANQRDAEIRPARLGLTAAQVDEIETVITWTNWLHRDNQAIVYAIAEGFSLRKISRMVGIDHKTVKARWMTAMVNISRAIENEGFRQKLKEMNHPQKKIPHSPHEMVCSSL